MAVRFKTLDLSNPGYRSNDIELITSQGNTIVLPSSRLRPKRYINLTNNTAPTQSYYVDYNDPYALNSFADAILNQEAKRRRYGDVFGSPWLNIINTPVAALDVLYNTTIAPIAAGIKGDDISFGQGLGAAGLNTLMNFGETMDIVANPVKGMIIEGYNAAKNNEDVWSAIGKGFINSVGYGDSGRKNYDYDTGNLLTDIGLESVSDPLTWLSLGFTGAVKGAAKGGATAVTKAAAKGFKEVTEEVVQEGTERIIKEAAQEVSQESAERLGKRLQKDLVNLLKSPAYTTPTLNPIKKIQQTFNNVMHGSTIDDDTVKALLKGYANSADDNVKLAAKAALQNYTDETSKLVLDSLDKVKFAAAALRGEETFEKFLRGGVMYTSPFVGWKGVKLGKDALKVQLLKKLAKEGVDNLADYLIKYSIVNDTFTNVSDATKKELDSQLIKHHVKEELKILNSARDIQTRLRNVFSKAVDVLHGSEGRTITSLESFNQLLLDLQGFENALQTLFKNHRSAAITDFKSYKSYIDSCIKLDYIPEQYAVALQELDTFLKQADELKIKLQQSLEAIDAPPVSDISRFYESVAVDLCKTYNIDITKFIESRANKVYKISNKTRKNVYSIVSGVKNRLVNLFKEYDTNHNNPLLNTLEKRVKRLDDLLNTTTGFEKRIKTILNIADIDVDRIKKLKITDKVEELKQSVEVLERQLKTAPKSKHAALSTKITELQLQLNSYTDMLNYQTALKEFDKEFELFVSDFFKNYDMIFAKDNALEAVYDVLNKFEIDTLLNPPKVVTNSVTKSFENLSELRKKSTADITRIIDKETHDELATMLTGMFHTNNDAVKDVLHSLFRSLSDAELIRYINDYSKAIATYKACELLYEHADKFDGLIIKNNAAAEALDATYDTVTKLMSNINDTRISYGSIFDNDSMTLDGLIDDVMVGEAPGKIPGENLLEDIDQLLEPAVSAGDEIYDSILFFSKHLEKEDVAVLKQYIDQALKILENPKTAPIRIHLDADAVRKGTTIYKFRSGMDARQQALLNLPELRDLAESVFNNTGVGVYLNQLAKEGNSTASEIIKELQSYYCFSHYFNNLFELPRLGKLNEKFKWGWLDTISGLQNARADDILEHLEKYISDFEDQAIVNAIQRGEKHQAFNLEEAAKKYIQDVVDELANKTDEESIALRKRLLELNDVGAHDALADCKRTAGLYLANPELQKQIDVDPNTIKIVMDTEASGKNTLAEHIHQIAYYSVDGKYAGDIKIYADAGYDDELLAAFYKKELDAGMSMDDIKKLFDDTYRVDGLPSEAEGLSSFIKQIQEIEQATGKRVVLMAHNGDLFDYELVHNRLARFKQDRALEAFDGFKKIDTLSAWHRASGIPRLTPEELQALTDITEAYACALQDSGTHAFGKITSRGLPTALRTLAAEIKMSDNVSKGLADFAERLQEIANPITDVLKNGTHTFDVKDLPFVVFHKNLEDAPITHAMYKGIIGASEVDVKTVMDLPLENKYFILKSGDTLDMHQQFVEFARSIERTRSRIKSDRVISKFTIKELHNVFELLKEYMPKAFKERAKPAENLLTLYAQLKTMARHIQKHQTYLHRVDLSESALLNLFDGVFEGSRKNLKATLIKEIFEDTSTVKYIKTKKINLNADVMSDNYLTNRGQTVLEDIVESNKIAYKDPILAQAQTGVKAACEDLDEVQKVFKEEYTDLAPGPGEVASKEFLQRDKELRNGAKVFNTRALERFKTQTAEEIYQELYLSGGRKVVALGYDDTPLSDALVKELQDKGVYVSEPIKKEYGIIYYMVADYNKLPKTAVPIFEEAFDVLPSIPKLNARLLHLRKVAHEAIPDIGCTAGDRLTTQALDYFDIGFMRDVGSKNTEALKYLTTSEDLHKAGFFKQTHADHLVIGPSWARGTLAPVEDMVFDETNNIFKKVLNNVVECYNDKNKTINYLSMYFNDDMKLSSSPIWGPMSDDAVYNIYKLNPDNVCVIPKKSKHTSTVLGDLEKGGIKIEVVKIDLTSPKAVKQAREMGAIIIPRAQYATLANTINKWELHPVLKFFNSITNTYKAGYLASLGTVFRNAFSGVMNNYFTMDQPIDLPKTVKHWFQSLQDYNNYMDIIRGNMDDVIHIFKIRNVEQQTKLLTELFTNKGITSMPAEYFRTMHSFMQHQASGGLSEDLLKAMRIISDEADKASPDLAKKYYKILYSLPLVKQLGNMNNIVEHASRWSLYTMQIQNGATVNEAISAVIRTHFDYADKTYAQTIAEVFLPFMTFSMKNLEFYANLVDECTWVLPVVRDFMTPVWDFDSLTAANEQLYESYDRRMELDDYAKLKAATPWTAIQTAQLYHMLAGNILLPLDRTAYKTYEDYNGALKKELKNVYQVIKLNPAFMDAVSLATNPVDAVSNRLGVPYKYLGLFLRNLYEGKSPIDGFDLGDLPLVGPVWQRFGGNALFDPTVKTAIDKVEDSGNILNILPSLFSTAYLNPTRVEDVKTPEQMEKFLYKQKMLYQKYGVENGTSQVYLNIRRNKTYPRKISFKRTPVWKAINNYKQPTRRYQNYYTTQRNIDRFARNNVYKRLYTTTGYSRMALNMGPTTAKNLKYRIAAIRNMYRYK